MQAIAGLRNAAGCLQNGLDAKSERLQEISSCQMHVCRTCSRSARGQGSTVRRTRSASWDRNLAFGRSWSKLWEPQNKQFTASCHL